MKKFESWILVLNLSLVNSIFQVNSDQSVISVTAEPMNHIQSCHIKASAGECSSNPDYMFANCSPHCVESEFATTLDVPLVLHEEHESEDEEEDKNASYIQVNFAVEQRIHPDHSMDPNMIKETLHHIVKTNNYMGNFLSDAFSNQHDIPDAQDDEFVYSECYNSDAYCISLAIEGKCIPPEHYDEDEINFDDADTYVYEFMMRYCAPACQTCNQLMDMLEYEEQVIGDCVPDRESDIFEPGDINRMFERIVEDAAKHDEVTYSVNILSRPRAMTEHNNIIEETPLLLDNNISDTPDGPWILTIDNFLSAEECDRLIQLGHTEVYEASGLVEEDEMTEEEWQEALKEPDRVRTSTNAWCMDECYEDEIAKQVIAKIENLTGVPDNYQEWLQLVKYVPGQFYKMHHDNSEEIIDGLSGPRLLTVFMYLNDVEEGGATRFNDLLGDGSMVQLDVFPRKGTALIWPSVLNESPNHKIDYRTFHEAMVVTKGVKYGANAWLHMRDFKSDEDDCDYEEYEWIMKKRKLLE